MMALAFLPEWEIDIAFAALCQRKPDGLQIDDIIRYMERTWINGTYQYKMWSVFGINGPQTSNHLEGWHNKLSSFIGCRHPNIYQLLELITKEQATTEVLLVQLEAGSQPPQRKRKYVALDQRLDQVTQQYINGEKTIDEYIRAVAYNLCVSF